MIFELYPHLSPRIWGGVKLNKYKSIPIDNSKDPLGETWEVSTHPEGISKIQSNQKLLNEYVQLKYLVKFLDTADVLSVQAHPHDEYSLRVENQKGKSECWIILEAEENAGIYLGFKKGITKLDLEKYLREKKAVDELLNFYPVKPGEFFLVPAGTIHAIGKGVTLVEVQQSSGVTYRVWDWNRLDSKGNSRELHVQKAMDILVDQPSKNTLEYFQYKSDIFNLKSPTLLTTHDDFELTLYSLNAGEKVQITDKNCSVILLTGQIKINQLELKNYHSAIAIDESNLDISASEKSHFIVVK